MNPDREAPARPIRASVRRVDERLGLAVERTGLGPLTLVTYARDHVTVRTPSRPDFHDGNTLDLEAPPRPERLEHWVRRVSDTMAVLGVRHRQLRWEEPLAPDAPAAEPTPDPALARVAGELGLRLSAVTVLLLDTLVEPPAAPAELVRLDPPSPSGRQAADRAWHAATVLYRYEAGTTPDDWRDWDRDFVAWSVEQQRALAAAGRCAVWIALRQGAPVARLTMLHDRQGLAAIEDVVTHPVHRERGIAAALTAAAVAGHLAGEPGARVGLSAAPGSSAERLYRRLGFRPHATVWTASGSAT